MAFRWACTGIGMGSAAKPSLPTLAWPRFPAAIRRSSLICSSSASYRASTYAPLPATVELPADNKPRLINRHISVNPLDTAAALAANAFSKLDLLIATTVDKAAWMTWAAAISVGIMATLGLCLFQQLGSGQPPWLQLALEDALGPTFLLGLAKLVPVVAAAFPMLWHLRTWWAGSIEMFRNLLPGPSSLSSELSVSALAVSPTCTLAVVVRLAAMVAAVSAAGATGLAAPFAILLPVLLSLVPFAVVIATMPGRIGAGTSTQPTPAASANATASAAMSVQADRTASSTGTTSTSSASATPAAAMTAPDFAKAMPLLVPVLASDAAALAAVLLWSGGVPPFLLPAVAAGAALSASLAAIALRPQYAQRLAPIRAAIRDRATVHITIRTDFGSQLDTSVGKRPLQVTVGSAVDEFASQRLGSEAAAEVQAVTAADTYLEPERLRQQGSGAGAQAGTGAGPSTSARTSASTATSGSGSRLSQTRAEAGASAAAEEEEDVPDLPAWAVDPLSPELAAGTMRFRTPTFALVLDALLPGMLVGEKASVQVYNPPPDEGGYINPELVWWQPLADVEAKFKGRDMPAPGQVFWFPLGPGPRDNLVPVRVNAVNEEFVELDGNDHIEGGDMVVEVELVALEK